jgi:ATP-dependent Clp protease, protease subunit
MIIVPPERKIYIAGDLTEELTTDIIQSIHKLDRTEEVIDKYEDNPGFDYEKTNYPPMEIVIDSYGGDIYSMFAIYDAMTQASCPVHTLALGKVMSASVLLLAAGEKGKRRSGRSTTFMIHQASITDMSGKPKYIADYSKHISKLDKVFYREMLSLSIKTEDWEEICEENDDYYFNAVAAMSYGIIDEII